MYVPAMQQSPAPASASLFAADELSILVRFAERAVPLREGPGRDLERGSYVLLAHLGRAGSARSADLARALHLNASTVSRQVAAVGREGLIDRIPDPADHRAFEVRLTSHGRVVLARLREMKLRRLHAAFETWSEQEVRTFALALRRLNEGLDSADFRLRDDADVRPSSLAAVAPEQPVLTALSRSPRPGHHSSEGGSDEQ